MTTKPDWKWKRTPTLELNSNQYKLISRQMMIYLWGSQEERGFPLLLLSKRSLRIRLLLLLTLSIFLASKKMLDPREVIPCIKSLMLKTWTNKYKLRRKKKLKEYINKQKPCLNRKENRSSKDLEIMRKQLELKKKSKERKSSKARDIITSMTTMINIERENYCLQVDRCLASPNILSCLMIWCKEEAILSCLVNSLFNLRCSILKCLSLLSLRLNLHKFNSQLLLKPIISHLKWFLICLNTLT